jgi:hypothetical protein
MSSFSKRYPIVSVNNIWLKAFVGVGTLDHPDALPPDVHIFTATRQPWFDIPEGAPAFPELYERDKVWRPSSLSRMALLAPAIEAFRRQND